jgi:hypothetical protein
MQLLANGDGRYDASGLFITAYANFPNAISGAVRKLVYHLLSCLR